jgi:hypothetical protein
MSCVYFLVRERGFSGGWLLCCPLSTRGAGGTQFGRGLVLVHTLFLPERLGLSSWGLEGCLEEVFSCLLSSRDTPSTICSCFRRGVTFVPPLFVSRVGRGPSGPHPPFSTTSSNFASVCVVKLSAELLSLVC